MRKGEGGGEGGEVTFIPQEVKEKKKSSVTSEENFVLSIYSVTKINI